MPGVGLGIGKCPYDPIDNSTAIYVDGGNPGGFPALVRDFKLSGIYLLKFALIRRTRRKILKIKFKG